MAQHWICANAILSRCRAERLDLIGVACVSYFIIEDDYDSEYRYNGTPLAVTPPNFIELEITETDPGLKGDTAQGGSKPATLSTGAVVRVPLFITEGEVIRVDTRTGEYVSRASKS